MSIPSRSDGPIPQLTTQRLLLRAWRSSDRAPFAAVNADPEVMRHFPSTLSRAASDGFADAIESHFARHGFGLWAVEVPGLASFAGFVGLAVPGFEAAFTPCVEIGWRLARDQQGRGYATEAALAVLRFGFESLDLAEIVSFTVPANVASRRVMEKIGLRHDADADFEHPRLPVGHPLRRHVLYRIKRRFWSPRRLDGAALSRPL